MTDVQELMKLHDEAIDATLVVAFRHSGNRDQKTRAALESALQQMAAEIERLKADKDELDKSWHDIARTAQLEAEALRAEIERLTLRLKMTSDTMNGYMLERDALKAKLDEAEQQEPVVIVEADSLREAKNTPEWCRTALLYSPTHLEVQRKPSTYTKLYTRPIPAQDVNTGLVEALKHAVEIAENKRPGTWDDLLQYRAALSQSQAAPARVVPDGYLCEIEEADFEKSTVTVKMLTSDYKVRAGKYLLAAAPQPKEGV